MPEHYLFIINDGLYWNEHPFNALRLAMSLAKRDDTQVNIFMTGDGITYARKGQKTPMVITTSSAC